MFLEVIPIIHYRTVWNFFKHFKRIALVLLFILCDIYLYSLLTTTKCVKRRACWANTKHNERLPEDGRGRGTISADKTTPTKYKYQKCKYT